MENVRKIIVELNVRKAIGLDGVSNWVLRECMEDLAETVTCMIEHSLQEGKIPKVWL